MRRHENHKIGLSGDLLFLAVDRRNNPESGRNGSYILHLVFIPERSGRIKPFMEGTYSNKYKRWIIRQNLREDRPSLDDKRGNPPDYLLRALEELVRMEHERAVEDPERKEEYVEAWYCVERQPRYDGDKHNIVHIQLRGLPYIEHPVRYADSIRRWVSKCYRDEFADEPN